MLQPGVIYALRDPRTGMVRYVGKSVGDGSERLRAHTKNARRNVQQKCARWVRGLLAEGLHPELVILERTVEAELDSCEKQWIRILREGGADLTNMTAGGEGGDTSSARVGPRKSPPSFTQEHRAALSRGSRERRWGREGLPFPIAEASALYLSGWSLQRIADHIGWSLHAVHTNLLNAGVEMRPRRSRGVKHSPETLRKLREKALEREARRRAEGYYKRGAEGVMP